MGPMLLPVGPTEPSSALRCCQAPEAPGDQASRFGLFKKTETNPHLNSGAAVPLPQLCCSRPSSCTSPLLAAAPLLAAICTRLPDPGLAEAPRSGRCLVGGPRATPLLLDISHAAASAKALPLLSSDTLMMSSHCPPASAVTKALLELCKPLLLSSSLPAASVVTAARPRLCCRLSAGSVLSIGGEVAPMLLLLLPALCSGPICPCGFYRT